jgi:hypothetical protein
MTDRETLELAARAAGYVFGEYGGKPARQVTTKIGAARIYWNPLTDDGDALRLAVYLEFEIDITSTGVAVRTRCGLKVLVNKTEEPDLCAAARRAITRAAAEIGRQMEETK